MKILLDENIPERIIKEFWGNHEVYSAKQMKWNGKKNSELLSLCDRNGFDILITLDKNLQYQQNLTKFNVKIILLKLINNRFITIKRLIPKVLEIINKGLSEQITVIS